MLHLECTLRYIVGTLFTIISRNRYHRYCRHCYHHLWAAHLSPVSKTSNFEKRLIMDYKVTHK